MCLASLSASRLYEIWKTLGNLPEKCSSLLKAEELNKVCIFSQERCQLVCKNTQCHVLVLCENSRQEFVWFPTYSLV